MKKLSLLFSVLFLFLSLKGKAQQTNAEVAGQFIKTMSQQQYDEALTLFDTSIAQVNKEVLQKGWQQITTMFGGYKSYYLPESVDQNAIAMVIGVRFEKSTQGFSCSFNDKHQLVSFLLAPAPADKEAKQEVPAALFPEEELTVAVSGGNLKGTLMIPANPTAMTPVALIIAGSGATDRNCNNGSTLNTYAYKMLAEALAANGIASFRYDKRLIGQSNGFEPDESRLSFDNYVQDAVQLISYLKEKKAYIKVFIIGHSEGALIGTLAAQKSKVNALVSLCGAGENIALTLKRQMASEEANAVIDELKNGHLTNSVPSSLQVTFRPSVQPYLISWMKYEPAAELHKLQVPVMIIGGTTDIQVPVADAELLKKAAPKAQLLLITGMNHILKDAPADQTANLVTYTQPNLPLNKELTAALVRFLGQK